jgi:hypothetical protein
VVGRSIEAKQVCGLNKARKKNNLQQQYNSPKFDAKKHEFLEGVVYKMALNVLNLGKPQALALDVQRVLIQF